MAKRLEYVKLWTYRWRKPSGKYYYYTIKECSCGERFISFKYDNRVHCDECSRGQVGRPAGYRLSDDTKNTISMGRTGTIHDQETKDKISEALTGMEYVWTEESYERWKANNPVFRTGKDHPRHRDYRRHG